MDVEEGILKAPKNGQKKEVVVETKVVLANMFIQTFRHFRPSRHPIVLFLSRKTV